MILETESVKQTGVSRGSRSYPRRVEPSGNPRERREAALGEKVEAIRSALSPEMSQAEAGQILGIPQTTVSEIETSAFRKITKAFACELDELRSLEQVLLR